MDKVRRNAFLQAEDYYIYFEAHGTSLDEAVRMLVNTENMLAMYVLVQIYGNDAIVQRLSWGEMRRCDNKYFSSLVKGDYNYYFKHLCPLLRAVEQSQIVGIQQLMEIPVKELSYEAFRKAFSLHVQRRESISARISMSPPDNIIKQEIRALKAKLKKVDLPIYDKYDHSLSDW